MEVSFSTDTGDFGTDGKFYPTKNYEGTGVPLGMILEHEQPNGNPCAPESTVLQRLRNNNVTVKRLCKFLMAAHDGKYDEYLTDQELKQIAPLETCAVLARVDEILNDHPQRLSKVEQDIIVWARETIKERKHRRAEGIIGE